MPTNRLIEKEKVATYANVLFDAANAEGGQDSVLKVRQQANQIVAIIRGNMELASVLTDTVYAPEQRASLARNVFADCETVLRETLAVMAEHGDIELFGRVCANYEDQLAKKLNITIVEVTTVVELDDHLREVITKKAASELGTEIVLVEKIDKSIMGGIVMSANGQRIDASVSLMLEKAREVLKQSTDGGEC